MGQLNGIRRFRKLAPRATRAYLIYNGDPVVLSDDVKAIHFTQSKSIFEAS